MRGAIAYGQQLALNPLHRKTDFLPGSTAYTPFALNDIFVSPALYEHRMCLAALSYMAYMKHENHSFNECANGFRILLPEQKHVEQDKIQQILRTSSALVDRFGAATQKAIQESYNNEEPNIQKYALKPETDQRTVDAWFGVGTAQKITPYIDLRASATERQERRRFLYDMFSDLDDTYRAHARWALLNPTAFCANIRQETNGPNRGYDGTQKPARLDYLNHMLDSMESILRNPTTPGTSTQPIWRFISDATHETGYDPHTYALIYDNALRFIRTYYWAEANGLKDDFFRDALPNVYSGCVPLRFRQVDDWFIQKTLSDPMYETLKSHFSGGASSSDAATDHKLGLEIEQTAKWLCDIAMENAYKRYVAFKFSYKGFLEHYVSMPAELADIGNLNFTIPQNEKQKILSASDFLQYLEEILEIKGNPYAHKNDRLFEIIKRILAGHTRYRGNVDGLMQPALEKIQRSLKESEVWPIHHKKYSGGNEHSTQLFGMRAIPLKKDTASIEQVTNNIVEYINRRKDNVLAPFTTKISG